MTEKWRPVVGFEGFYSVLINACHNRRSAIGSAFRRRWYQKSVLASHDGVADEIMGQ